MTTEIFISFCLFISFFCMFLFQKSKMRLVQTFSTWSACSATRSHSASALGSAFSLRKCIFHCDFFAAKVFFEIRHIFEGSFSAVSKPIFASKRSHCSIFQALQDLHTSCCGLVPSAAASRPLLARYHRGKKYYPFSFFSYFFFLPSSTQMRIPGSPKTCLLKSLETF